MILACIFQGIFMTLSEEETINSAREFSNSDCTTQDNIKVLFLPNSLAKTAMWNLKTSSTSLSRLSFFILCSVSSVFGIINEQPVTTPPLGRALM